jgi:hypothetical protein
MIPSLCTTAMHTTIKRDIESYKKKRVQYAIACPHLTMGKAYG